jgi:hypothetical protein
MADGAVVRIIDVIIFFSKLPTLGPAMEILGSHITLDLSTIFSEPMLTIGCAILLDHVSRAIVDDQALQLSAQRYRMPYSWLTTT